VKSDSIPLKFTIKDVAKHASVSTATVSRVLAGSNQVSENLRIRVLESIDALDYIPNQVGRSLRRQTTNIIGLVITDIQNPFFTSILRGVQDVFQEHKLVVLTANSDENPTQELLHLQILRSQGVRGLIFAPARSDYYGLEYLFNGMAVVAIDRLPLNINVDSVIVDNVAGAKVATQHLLDLGHRRIGFIAGISKVTTGKDRLRGYLEALQEAGLHRIDELIQDGSFLQKGGYKAMSNLLDLPIPPTAIVSSNNLMSLGALQALHERGVKIPDEIAVVGFDDMPWAPCLQPPLTVIAQPTYEIGRQAAHLLLERFESPDFPARNLVLETNLIIRASTAFEPWSN
jgi:DNA-binding LacI/PurR family transcriptional regulator